MNRTTFTSRATTALVAAVAGYASYTHIFGVAERAGEHTSVAAVLPLSIDGLILVGTLAMLEDKRDGRQPRLSARLAVAFGVVATLAANIASAQPSTSARLVAAVPPIAFLFAIEVLSRRGKIADVPIRGDIPTDDVGAADPIAHEFGTAEVVEGYADARTPAPDPWQYAVPVATVAETATDERVSAAVDVPGPVRRKRVTPRSLTAAERVTAAHAKEPAATHERIAKVADVSVSTVKRHRPTGSPSEPAPAETRTNGHRFDLTGVQL